MTRTRTCLLLGPLLLSGLAQANQTYTDPQGYNWDLYSSTYGYVGDGTSDAYDSWPYLCVTTAGNTAACSSAETYLGSGETTEDGGREVVMGAATIQGLQVSRKIYVPSSGSVGFARYLEMLTNPTGSPITVTVRVGTVGSTGSGDLGSDSGTVITAASDGSTAPATGQYWLASDDGTDGGGDPSLGHVFSGPGGAIQTGRVLQYQFGDAQQDNLSWEYTVTVPAGATRILMHFQTQQPNRSSSAARSAELDTLPSYAASGLSTAEQAAIVNWRLIQLPVAEAGGPYTGAEGAAIAVTGAGSTSPSSTLTTYEWDCANDGSYEISSSAPTASCTYNRYGSYTAKLRVTDKLGQQATDTATVTVTNVAPVINTVDVSGDLTETGSVTFSVASLSHPGTGDTLSYSWSFSDGQTATGSSVTRTFPDNAVYTWTVTVRDTGNLSDTEAGQVVIANRPPTIQSITLPTGLSEGAAGVVTASASDPAGSADPLTYVWNWGDGSPNSTVSQASTSHAWSNSGTFTVTVTVSDGDGGTATRSGTITIGNLNPSITSFNATTSGLEGSTFTYSATASDPGADTLTYTWAFGDSSTATGSSVSHIYTNEGSYTLTLTVSDGDGGTAVRTATVTVTNASPTISSTTIPASAGEGQVLTFSVAASDPGNDPLSVQWVFGDGGSATGTTVTHAYADQGAYNVTVTVLDNAGAGTARSGQVVVSNVNPTIVTLDGTFSGSQGDTLSFTAQATDPGLDTLTYRWDFGDGSSVVVGVDRTSVSHTYTRIGSYTLTLTVSDEDGGSASSSRTVSIGNSGPSISGLIGDSTGDEGELLSFQVSASDPGGDTLTYTWNFGDGSAPQTGTTLTTVKHTYTDNGSYTLTVTVSDPSAATATATFNVAIANIAPSVTPVPNNQSVNQGVLTSFTAGSTDPGNDEVALSWEFDDGSAPVAGTSVSHAWYQADVYTVTITAKDDDGGKSSESFVVTVNNLAPELASIVGPTSLNEGQSGSWTVVATDASGQPVSLLWEFGDGGSASGASVSHTYDDDGSYTLRVTGTDANGATDISEAVVVVSNLNPVLTQVVIPTEGVQGQVLSFSVSASDVPADPLSYRWNFGNGAEVGSAQATYSWPRPGTYPVSITVTDDSTGTITSSGSVVISNVVPAIDRFVADSAGDEGSPVAVSFNASDASGTEPSASVDWGDGTVETALKGTDLTHVYADNGAYTITLSVTDQDGASTTSASPIAIANVNPSILDLQGATFGQEGDLLSFTASVSDPAQAKDPLTLTWDFGDGSAPVSGLDLTTATHRYVLAGQYTLTLTVADDDGGSSSRTSSINVGTAAPYISKAIAQLEGDEGSPFSFSVEAADPTDQTLSYTFDFGDGQTLTQDSGTAEHVYDDDGFYPVSVTVTDPDALTAVASFEVDVADVPPTFQSTPPQQATEGVQLSYAVEATAAPLDIITLELVSGPEGASLDVSGLLTWTPTLAQAKAGQATFSLKALDDDGSEALQDFTVTITIQDDDQDGIADSAELACGLDPANPEDAGQDADGDGRTNLEEYQAGTSMCTSNQPAQAMILSPENGAELAELQPSFQVQFTLPYLLSTDPVPAGLQVELELYRDEALIDLAETVATSELSVAMPQGETPSSEPLTLQAVLVPAQLLADNADLYVRARAKDAYGSGDWSEVNSYFVNSSNDAPGMPMLSYPGDGASIGSTSVTFEVNNADDVDRDPLTLSFELADAAALDTLLASADGIVQSSSGTTQWAPELVLEAGHTYAWRARATDDQGLSGEWTTEFVFTVLLENHAPAGTEIVSPADGEEVSDNPPVIEVSTSLDVDGDAVGYLLQLSTASNFRDALEVDVEPGPAAGETVGIEVGEALTENTLWYARAQSTDGQATSEWSETVSFFVNSANDAPGAPTLQNPANGSTQSTSEVSFTVNNAVDPDGDALTYTVVAQGPGGAEVRIENVPEDASGTTTLTGSLSALGTWTWTAFATDEEGLEGPQAEPNTLIIEGDDPQVSPTPGETGTPLPPPDSGGCNCSMPETSSAPSAGAVLLGLLGLLGLSARRRRR